MSVAPLLAEASACEVAELIRMRRVSSLEVTEACLARIDLLDPHRLAYVTVLRDTARTAAAQADADLAKGHAIGPLHGVPVSVKDALLVPGTPTTVGSELLRGYSPPEREATCVGRLRQAGAVILGKVNVGSGMTSNPSNPRLRVPDNPWHQGRTPGGSSSGSAVAVALAMGYGSVGTDLGGSIRIPAAFTGVVGLKPTFGLVSQHGDVFGMGTALEHVGPLTRTVRDAALMLRTLAGYDPRDPTSVDRPIPDYVALLEHPSGGRRMRVGWARDGGPLGAEADVLARMESAIQLLAGRGMDVEAIELPRFDEAWWDQFTLLDEWQAYDADVDEREPYRVFVRANLRGKRQRVVQGLMRRAEQIRDAYRNLFTRFDLLAVPTVPITAKPFDLKVLRWRGVERETFALHLVNTWTFNVTGHPAISLPCGFDSAGLPVGLQLAARHFQEEDLLVAAAAFEAAAGGFPMPRVP
jgi:aspartyl-tRNA(Asn)/glutamyl-tRNA(Gln) amidotransferase subunit A